MATLRRLAALGILGLATPLLNACGGMPASDRPAASAADRSPVCRVGPDGGPVLAERGIGGTGTRPDAPRQSAERGIGGTGIDSPGYGILGVITGFASICIAGQEVGMADEVPIAIDGRPATQQALRAGQVAVIEAAGTAPDLQARRVAIRTEVSGPVQSVSGNTLQVAGQSVAIGATTLGDATPRPGAWISVSGLRRPDGAIQATRIDPREPGEISVRGMLARTGGVWQIGGLPIRPTQDPAGMRGHSVVAFGTAQNGVLMAAQLAPDPAGLDPASAFDRRLRVLAVESFGGLAGEHLLLNRLENAPFPETAGLRRAVIEIEREPDGTLRPAFIRREGRDRGPADISGPAAKVGPLAPSGAKASAAASLSAPAPSRQIQSTFGSPTALGPGPLHSAPGLAGEHGVLGGDSLAAIPALGGRPPGMAAAPPGNHRN